jgi:hypothetical protein
MRALVAPLLPLLVRLVLGNARLKGLARRVLKAAPRLHARLQSMMARAAMTRRVAPQAAGPLSARARELHAQLARVRASAL